MPERRGYRALRQATCAVDCVSECQVLPFANLPRARNWQLAIPDTIPSPRAGAGEHKVQTAAFDQAMGLVENHRQLLDFVDDHDPGCGRPQRQFVGQPARVGAQALVDAVVKQVEGSGVGKRLAQQPRFACLPGPKQEARACGEHWAEVEAAGEKQGRPPGLRAILEYDGAVVKFGRKLTTASSNSGISPYNIDLI